MLSIIDAKYLKNYQIQVIFNNHIEGVIDLQEFVENDHRKIFQELRDLKKFSQIKLALDTITWENGADLAPEYLYELLTKQKIKTNC